ncbi:hypothetical protein CEXT_336101 [Caerostris extrusa]|uniref:Uncharacterized protein n=1 Tax=Caerostris extrusa TaxID=172846 RepID=A0AAV4S4B3_CAEEX|nr:hypothetical protein CEXT_336101 [Caerostris extrusa]
MKRLSLNPEELNSVYDISLSQAWFGMQNLIHETFKPFYVGNIVFPVTSRRPDDQLASVLTFGITDSSGLIFHYAKSALWKGTRKELIEIPKSHIKGEVLGNGVTTSELEGAAFKAERFTNLIKDLATVSATENQCCAAPCHVPFHLGN